MRKIEIKTDKGKEKTVNSLDLEKIIRETDPIITVSDISNQLDIQSVMLYDCRLHHNVEFKLEPIEDINLQDLDLDEDFFTITFEDIQDFLFEMISDIEDEIRQHYRSDMIRISYDIYDFNEHFSDIKFVMAISFRDIRKRQLEDIAQRAGQKQVFGSSKYYH